MAHEEVSILLEATVGPDVESLHSMFYAGVFHKEVSLGALKNFPTQSFQHSTPGNKFVCRDLSSAI